MSSGYQAWWTVDSEVTWRRGGKGSDPGSLHLALFQGPESRKDHQLFYAF